MSVKENDDSPKPEWPQTINSDAQGKDQRGLTEWRSFLISRADMEDCCHLVVEIKRKNRSDEKEVVSIDDNKSR